MAHYYFDVLNGNGLTTDEEGQDYATLEQARLQALESIRSIVSEEAAAGVVDLSGEVRVRTEREQQFTIAFADAVKVILPRSNDR
jgi:hypothetical protein